MCNHASDVHTLSMQQHVAHSRQAIAQLSNMSLRRCADGGREPGEVAATAAARRAPVITDTASTFDSQLFTEPSDASYDSKRSSSSSSSSNAGGTEANNSERRSSSSSSSSADGTDANAAEQLRPASFGTPNETPGTCSNAGNSTGGSAGDAACSSGGNRIDHGGDEGSRMAAVGWCPAEYPPLRRAQRLSYAMPSILSDISPSEGRQVRICSVAPWVSVALLLLGTVASLCWGGVHAVATTSEQCMPTQHRTQPPFISFCRRRHSWRRGVSQPGCGSFTLRCGSTAQCLQLWPHFRASTARIDGRASGPGSVPSLKAMSSRSSVWEAGVALFCRDDDEQS